MGVAAVLAAVGLGGVVVSQETSPPPGPSPARVNVSGDDGPDRAVAPDRRSDDTGTAGADTEGSGQES